MHAVQSGSEVVDEGAGDAKARNHLVYIYIYLYTYIHILV